MASAVTRFGKSAPHWISAGVAVAGILMLVTAAIGAIGTLKLYESEAEVSLASRVYQGLERLLSLERDAETGTRGYVITGRDDYLEPYRAATTQLSPHLDELAQLLRAPAQHARLDELKALVEQNQHELARIIEARRANGFEAAQALVQSNAGKAFMDRARAIVRTMEDVAQQQLTAREHHARRTRDIAIGAGLASGLLTILVFLSLGYFVRWLLATEARAAEDLFQQKELLTVILAGIGDGVIATDLEGRITFFNKVAQLLTGVLREAAIGRPIDDIVSFMQGRGKHRADNPAIIAMKERRTVGHADQTRLVTQGGAETSVDVSGTPTFDEKGALVGAVLVMRDVSERERAEERFRLAVEAAPNAMVMIDRHGRITLVNSQTERLFDYSREDLMGKSIDMLVPDRFRGTHHAHRESFFNTPKARPMGVGRDLYGRRRDGSEFPIEIGLNPIETSQGVFVLSAIADITERKRAETELQQRSDELARSNRDLEQFAYVASHDLQEPLRAVAGPLQLLQRRYQGQLDERADEFIGHAVDGATRMQSLIDDLLSYSRVGRLEDAVAPIECEAMLAHALQNLSVLIHESAAQVTHDPLPPVAGVPTQLALLFQNLIGNAIKFRGKERPPHIHIGAQRLDGTWQFAIRDNGIGIEPQYYERIFLIFQRLHTRREYPGTGLGLALCKRIVEHHGGRIWVESTPGKGTTFFFTLRPVSDDAALPQCGS